ncbi:MULTISPECIES: TatD family hydrolase [unclassified Sedimentibacter]|uniref:TatD family hydrolase n=1 Tax=unclassified Sedimentibacter TaxID=2649220 RepID=UPI0027E04CD0|nr:TatD family hydrolase [Sedimentibacter sp. MB35-C1]WMJ77801.1 TatD family hydrolase [Sedimentibacter sp. MB35-C1]
MIDAHIHIDFYDKPTKIIKEIMSEDISAIFVTHLPELYEKQKLMMKIIPQIFLAVGFHPILINEYEFNKDLFVNAIKETKFVGEVGLDYSIAKTEKSQVKQKKIFEQICKSVNKHILSVHSRQAEIDVLTLLLKYKVENAIFHWYTGPKELIPDIVGAGYYFSLNQAMLRTNKGRGILKEIPLNRILIETDGPFSKYEGSIVEPLCLKEIYSAFGEFYNVGDMEDLVFQNMSSLIE